MRLTKRQREVLTVMRETGEELVYEPGGGWWFGEGRTNGKLGIRLLRLMLIALTQDSHDAFQMFVINEAGRRALEGLPPYCRADGQYVETPGELILSQTSFGEVPG